MQFKINLSDIKLLVELVPNRALVSKLIQCEKSGELYAKGEFATGRYLIELSEDEIDVVVDCLSAHFISHGLNNDEEPNSLGLQLETLIDIFQDD